MEYLEELHLWFALCEIYRALWLQGLYLCALLCGLFSYLSHSFHPPFYFFSVGLVRIFSMFVFNTNYTMNFKLFPLNFQQLTVSFQSKVN